MLLPRCREKILAIQRAQADRAIRDAEHAQEVKEALEALENVKVAVKTAESGKLFGSVTAADIVAAIEQAGGPKIDKHTIAMSKGHIKKVGDYNVTVELAQDVKASVPVVVEAE